MNAYLDGIATGLLIAGIIAANVTLGRLVVRDYRRALREERAQASSVDARRLDDQ